jgi:hypothetical protein
MGMMALYAIPGLESKIGSERALSESFPDWTTGAERFDCDSL